MSPIPRTLRGMTAAARDATAHSAARNRARRVRDGAFTALVIAASVFSSFFVFGAHVFAEVPDDLPPPWLAAISFLAALGAAAALRWRHRHPVLVAGIATVPPLFLIAEALAALIALAALAAGRRDHVLGAVRPSSSSRRHSRSSGMRTGIRKCR